MTLSAFSAAAPPRRLVRRLVLFAGSLLVMGFGVALTARSGLGTSPISSVPYALTFRLPLTFGMLTLLFNLLFVAAQKILLGRAFPPSQYGQIPVTLLFGAAIDLGMVCSAPLATGHYALRLLLLAAGNTFVALGICGQLIAELLIIPGDGLVRTLAGKFHRSFGSVKITFDATLTLLAVLLSLATLGTVEGVREGTLIAALSVGATCRFFLRRTGFLRRWCGRAAGDQL